MVWGSAFHLFFGNTLLGLLEGWLLARVFHLRPKRCIGFLILANYLSAWIGVALMSFLFETFATDIYAGLRVTWLLIVATYLLTLLLEWPFVAFCFRGTEQWMAASVKGSALIQSASYVLLFGGYWLLSGKSLYTDMDVVAPNGISPPDGVVIFFIAEADGDVYRSELGGSRDIRDIKVAELDSTNHWDHLELRESQADTNYWDLAVGTKYRGPKQDPVVLMAQVSTRHLIAREHAWRTIQYSGWGIAPFQVGTATNSTWRLGWAHWPDVGMWARSGTRTVRVAYGMPFGGWSPHRVIHLPGDKALLQLDAQQICLVDIPKRKIALIRKGYGVLAFQREQLIEPVSAGNPIQPVRAEPNRTSSAAGSHR